MPKFNMYQSLHTTVIGPGGQAGRDPDPDPRHAPPRRVRRRSALEVQGRQGTGCPSRALTTPASMIWVSAALDWQRETADPGEFLDSLRFEINTNEVYRLHATRRRHRTSQGSTPVDFAYAVTPRSATARIGARVNGRLVPLESVLANGDVVEIFTSKAENAGPSQDWLSFVRVRGPATRSVTGSPESVAMSRSRAARICSRDSCARTACRCSGC